MYTPALRIVSHFLAAVVLIAPAHAITYTVTLLHPENADGTEGYGTSGARQVGWGRGSATGGMKHALLWTGTADSAVDLNPIGFADSAAYGIYGSSQVGYGNGPPTGNQNHAILWTGTAASAVDLNPLAFTDSQAFGVFGASQVGYGFGPPTSNQNHAMLWTGTAASAVDMNPSGFTESIAYSVWGTTQVGMGSGPATEDLSHALLWNGTAASVIDLHPAEFSTSHATGVSGASQMGSGDHTVTGFSHALLWNGTAESVIDLHPSWLVSSQGYALSAAGQVGWGSDGESLEHAIYWNGGAESAIDLHPFLSAAYPSLTDGYSYATGISDDGVIIGFAASEALANPVAVLWTPLPDSVAADYNNDGVVDAADYVMWRKGTNALQNEVVTIGENTAGDYDEWRERFGTSLAGSGQLANVPEPATVVLLFTAMLTCGLATRHAYSDFFGTFYGGSMKTSLRPRALKVTSRV